MFDRLPNFLWSRDIGHFQGELIVRQLGILHTKARIKFEVSNASSSASIDARRRNGWHDLERPLNKGQGHSFWYQSISIYDFL